MKKLYYSLFLFVLTYSMSNAAIDPNYKQENASVDNRSIEGGCPPAIERLSMELNDVRSLIEIGGLTWMDRQIGNAAYEVPKGGGNHVIFAGSIWLGGLDVNGQLKLAGVVYRSRGNDFWPGPLSQNTGSGNYNPKQAMDHTTVRDFGEATITDDVCIKYDRFFTIDRAEVQLFARAFECGQDVNCNVEIELSNETLNSIYNWPAHGNTELGQDYYLAPFYDYPTNGETGDGVYNPEDGDYPWFDGILGRNDIECGVDRRVALYGDRVHWWVFNDKGNEHTESGGDPIGLEIRAQAFSVVTDDALNQMTFYNYEIINRSTETIYDTYFSQYCDADIGFAEDDYIGCDVARGLGYCYNATNFDPGQGGAPGYGENPPAVGIDFFEGPYQDADGIDNVGPRLEEQEDGTYELVVPSVQEAINGKGIVYEGSGTGFSDGIIDNERLGTTRFNYFNRPDTGPVTTHDPSAPNHYYNYMTGFWRDDSPLLFGGAGFIGTNGVTEIKTDYAFPNDSDPLWWATGGVNGGWDWSQTNVNGEGSSSDLGDKRFLQTTGPFTMTPGAVNNITLGVVYGRAFYGDSPYASVEVLKRNDTKAQALFDNCFKMIEAPDAPIIDFIEEDASLTLVLSNPYGNNVDESYEQEDSNISDPIDGSDEYDKFYRFEGYQIYQVINENVEIKDLENTDKARLVAQCDIENDIVEIINYEFDNTLGFSVPVVKVVGENEGIRHSFTITEDAFNTDGEGLINGNPYYFIAIAYAHNEYKEYDPENPDMLDGQKKPYLSSRFSCTGSTIKPFLGIPKEEGVIYEDNMVIHDDKNPIIQVLDGNGNGFRYTAFNQETEDEIISNKKAAVLTYKRNQAPIEVAVIDPTQVKKGYYELRFHKEPEEEMSEATWTMSLFENEEDENPTDVFPSSRSITVDSFHIIPEWGIALKVYQLNLECSDGLSEDCPERARYSEPIGSKIAFEDTAKKWLSGIKHFTNYSPQNWIASGWTNEDAIPGTGINNPVCYNSISNADQDSKYTNFLNGIITSGQLARMRRDDGCAYTPLQRPSFMSWGAYNAIITQNLPTVFQPNVDIVFTSDKSKWTRCPVIELNDDPSLSINGSRPGLLRQSPSVDKNGRQVGDAGYNAAQGDFVSPMSMGWFPGYAIDVDKGRRLNMAYCENSFLAGENGADMVWNPTSNMHNSTGSPLFGGQHTIYVFGGEWDEMPLYDDGEFVYNNLAQEDAQGYRAVYRNLSWVMQPLLAEGHELLETETRVSVRVNKVFDNYERTNKNEGNPLFFWSLDPDNLSVDNMMSKERRSIIVYPNPTRDKATINWGKTSGEYMDVYVLNSNGKQVISKRINNNNEELDVQALASGVYFLRMVVSTGEVVNQRIIKK